MPLQKQKWTSMDKLLHDVILSRQPYPFALPPPPRLASSAVPVSDSADTSSSLFLDSALMPFRCCAAASSSAVRLRFTAALSASSSAGRPARAVPGCCREPVGAPLARPPAPAPPPAAARAGGGSRLAARRASQYRHHCSGRGGTDTVEIADALQHPVHAAQWGTARGNHPAMAVAGGEL